MAIGNNLKDKLLDLVLRGQAYTPPSKIYASLHSGDPGGTGANEVPVPRQEVAFGPASGGEAKNIAPYEVEMVSATITHGGLWDSPTGGEFLWGGEVKEAKTYAAGDVARVKVGEHKVTLL